MEWEERLHNAMRTGPENESPEFYEWLAQSQKVIEELATLRKRFRATGNVGSMAEYELAKQAEQLLWRNLIIKRWGEQALSDIEKVQAEEPA